MNGSVGFSKAKYFVKFFFPELGFFTALQCILLNRRRAVSMYWNHKIKLFRVGERNKPYKIE